MRGPLPSLLVLVAVGVMLGRPPDARSEELPSELEDVGVDERLGERIPLDLTFTDHEGREVTLAEYVQGDVPVLFTLNYYGCPMLCGLQLNALNVALKELDWAPGENFRIVTVSFDPREGPDLAAAKREAYLEELGRGDVDWSFLVGDEENTQALADAFGYRFHYVEIQDQFAHPAVLMFVSPDGMISRYLAGLAYPTMDFRLALLEAADGRIGTAVDQFILSCFVYDPDAGSYVKNAWLIMRLGGVLTVGLIALMLVILWSRDRQRLSREMV